MTGKEFKILSITIASCGILLIGSGLLMKKPNQEIINKIYKLNINEKKVNESKTNIIKLKQMESEINTPLSVDVKDYLENITELETSIIKALKLDTSNININNSGTYTYTVSFKNKKFNGTYIIKEKKLPDVEITLKKLKLTKGTAIPTDISSYIKESLTDEVKNNIKIDLSKVNSSEVGNYQYTITYKEKMYTSTIEIYNETIIKPEETEKPEVTPEPTITPSPTPTPTITPSPTPTITPTPTNKPENEEK